MFQIVGRDALGGTRTLRVRAPTEEEARAIARQEGIVIIDRLDPPPVASLPTPEVRRLPPGLLSLLGCVGAVIGAVAMNGTEPPGLTRLDATL